MNSVMELPIQENYPIVLLDELCDLCSGITKGRKIYSMETANVPYMAVANVQDGKLRLENVKTIEATPVEIERYRLLPGDLLLTEGGDPDKLGRGAIWNGEIDVCIHQNHIFRARKTSERIDMGYLAHLVSSPYGKQYFLRQSKQTTGIASINMGQLKRFPVPLPPLEEQRRITAILDKADKLLGQSRLLLKGVPSVEQSIFESLFGAFVNSNTSYPVKPLEEIVRDNRIGLVRASNECGPEMPHSYLKMDAIGRNGRLLLHKATRTSASQEELADYSIQNGDVLFNTRNSRELVGKTAVYRGVDEMLFNNNLMRLRFNPGTVSPDFFRLFLGSREGSSELESRKSGTTSVCAIYWKNLKTMPVPLPPYELQIQLAKSLESLERLTVMHLRQEARCCDLARVLKAELVIGCH